MDISALRDEIKALERQNAELAEEVARYRALGNFDPNKENVLRFSKNPTDQRRKRPRSENSEAFEKSEISEEEKVLVKDLKEQLFREKKSKEKVLEIVKLVILNFFSLIFYKYYKRILFLSNINLGNESSLFGKLLRRFSVIKSRQMITKSSNFYRYTLKIEKNVL